MKSQFATFRALKPLCFRTQTLGFAFAFALMLTLCFTTQSNAQDFVAPPLDSGFAVVDEPVAPTAGLVTNNSESFNRPNELSTSAAALGVPAAGRLTDMFRRGGLLMIPIGICSFILVVFVFERFISLRKGRIIPTTFTKKFLEQLRDGQLTQNAATAICERDKSPMANVFLAGVLKWGRPAVEVEQAVLDEGERTSNRLRKYLRLINGVATVCPLLGLLGTVFGMIHAFDSIAVVDSAVADQAALTATGISQALLTTAAGLSVAIPALIAYLFFSSRVDKHVMEIDTLGMKVVNQISAEALADKPAPRRRSKAA